MRRSGRVIRALVLVGCMTAVAHLNSCRLDCPESIYLGEIQILDHDFFPFTGGEQFTFVNLSGKELVFFDSVDNKVTYRSMVMRTLCDHAYFGIQTSYYRSEQYYFYYHLLGGKTGFNYSYGVVNENFIPATDADTVLFDEFTSGFYSKESDPSLTYGFRYIVSRGNTLRPTTTTNNGFIRIISDTTLNGNHYTNLYCPKNRPGFFYSTSFGIVLFYYKGEWWHLKT